MNQKDYKAIAGIIKKYIVINLINKYGYGTNIKNRLISIAKELADYFEKNKGEIILSHYDVFNREQFLKDCGI